MTCPREMGNPSLSVLWIGTFPKSAQRVVSKAKEHFKQVLVTRIAEQESILATAQRETQVDAARHADPADQSAGGRGTVNGRS